MDGLGGVTAIDTSAACVTVSEVEPDTVLEKALIVTVPVATLLASPFVPMLLLIVAIVPSVELQCRVAVKSCVELSVKVPVAVNC